MAGVTGDGALRRVRAAAVLCLLACALAGCADPGYYRQAVAGHLDLLAAREPVHRLVADPQTPESLRQRLERTQHMREFASRTLGLPDNGSYRVYADLGRPWVVINVFAAPELDLEPVRWCFPLVGCLGYRGYFDRAHAERFAADLRAQGLDVWLGPVPAYSTLGWFDDPLLNTFIHWPVGRVADLMFHELAHQYLYVADDTEFNESFATVVGRLGARAWLRQAGSADERREYERFLHLQREFLELVLEAREALAEVYASTLSDAGKRAARGRILEELQGRYRALRDGPWGGYRGFDGWFAGTLGNARFAALQTYHGLGEEFEALFRGQDGDWPRFLQAVHEIGRLSRQERRVALAEALRTHPPPG